MPLNVFILHQGAEDFKEDIMSLSEDAAAKLRKESEKGIYDRAASVMKLPVRKALENFCGQNDECAEAVIQGGFFDECMKAVAKGCGTALSDLEAYRRAAAFYFKGADVEMTLTIRLAGDPDKPMERKPIVLDLEDFL